MRLGTLLSSGSPGLFLYAGEDSNPQALADITTSLETSD